MIDYVPMIIQQIKRESPDILLQFTNQDGNLRLFDLLRWHYGRNK